MMPRIRHYLLLLALPLGLLVISVSLRLAWHLFDLPTAPVLAESVGGWLYRYGAPVIFLSALLEGTLLLGGYFPGIFVITISVITARSPYEALSAVIVGSCGLFVAHLINYGLGRHGWYRVLARFGLSSAIMDARKRLERRGPSAIFLSYWMPSLAALTDTAAGVMHVPFRRFALWSLAGVVFWDSLAGTIMYFLGDRALALASPNGTQSWLVFAVLGTWMAFLILRDALRPRDEPLVLVP